MHVLCRPAAQRGEPPERRVPLPGPGVAGLLPAVPVTPLPLTLLPLTLTRLTTVTGQRGEEGTVALRILL